jgi:hypothetical protein
LKRSKDLPDPDSGRHKNATAQLTGDQGVRTVAKMKNGIVHVKMKPILSAEKSPGNQQKNGFINKHREIVPIKDMVNYAPSDNTRDCKKYQDSQFSADAHPRFLLQQTHLSKIVPPASE